MVWLVKSPRSPCFNVYCYYNNGLS